jgi:hypothetical protein
MTGVLITAGLAAGCSSSGGGGQTGGDSCSVSDSPTDSGDTYTVTLNAAGSDEGYFAQTASVTISGGTDAPSTSSEPLNTAIPLTLHSGPYVLRATIAPSSSAPSRITTVSCSTDVYIN